MELKILRKMALGCAGILLVSLAVAGGAAAQEASGKIVGTVTDQQGGVIPGATATVTNVATQVNVAAVTGSHGFYRASDYGLGVRHYSVRPADDFLAGAGTASGRRW